MNRKPEFDDYRAEGVQFRAERRISDDLEPWELFKFHRAQGERAGGGGKDDGDGDGGFEKGGIN